MAILEINWNPTQRHLRQFAIAWVVFFTGLGGLAWARGHSFGWSAALGVIAGLGVVDFFRPGFLRPAYLVWMSLAFPIGWTVSHLLLLIVYYLILTPVGLVMRIVGYDPMQRQFDRSAKSYWTPHDPSAESVRYFKQY
jgi:hypothetical protein